MSAAATAASLPEPRERPILFKAEMVRAILARRKTQTRRIAKGGRVVGGNLPYFDNLTEKLMNGDDTEVLCPYGVAGDRLWVKETWYCDHYNVGNFDGTRRTYIGRTLTDAECIAEWRGLPMPSIAPGHMMYYRADGEAGDQFEQLELPFRWSSAMFMPRWASRLTLEMTDVRLQRLQEITAEDALAEGIEPAPDQPVIEAFAGLWAGINGFDGPKSWATNPWVWTLSFRRLGP